MPIPELTVGDEYGITLCSGELRRWRYLGPDSSGRGWWRDAETQCEFSEDSLMYVWQVVERIAPPATK